MIPDDALEDAERGVVSEAVERALRPIAQYVDSEACERHILDGARLGWALFTAAHDRPKVLEFLGVQWRSIGWPTCETSGCQEPAIANDGDSAFCAQCDEG